MTVQSAIQLSTVYACVRVVSETVASLPLGVYEAKEDGNRKATEHPLYPLLHDEPNSEMTSFVLREVMLAHLLLWGNSYCQIIRSGRNQVTGLYPLLPDKMTVDRDKKGVLTYTYNMTSTGEQVVLSPYTTAYIEIPKKQGKSELGAAIALNMLCNDDEWRAEVYSCASDRCQRR